jgi:hypothetical protein
MSDAPSLSLPRHLVSFPKPTKQRRMTYGYIIDWDVAQRRGETLSDVSGRAQSPEPGPARPSKARPEVGLGSGFQQAWAWLKVQKAQSPGLKPGPHNQLRKYILNK